MLTAIMTIDRKLKVIFGLLSLELLTTLLFKLRNVSGGISWQLKAKQITAPTRN
jgi:hypothetical protein